MSVTFNFTPHERVYTEELKGNCCPVTIDTPYIIKSFWRNNNTNYYKTEARGDVGELTFEEDDLYPVLIHAPYVYPTLYILRDIVCVKAKAEVGKLVEVFIAEIQVPETYGGIPVIIYKDNANLLWNETDFVTLAQALILIEEFCD